MRVILDLDTGVDDALALAYALAQPQLDVLGVVATYGNVAGATALRNTRAVLEVLGRSDIPVLPGARWPSWAVGFVPDIGCAEFHGLNGLGEHEAAHYGARTSTVGTALAAEPLGDLARSAWHGRAADIAQLGLAPEKISVGGYPLPDPHAIPAAGKGNYEALSAGVPPVRAAGAEECAAAAETAGAAAPGAGAEVAADLVTPGARFIAETVARYGRDVTVISTGPLTDIAAALQINPSAAQQLRLVMMGGALTVPGNCYDGVAEANIIHDPEAANAVFHSGAEVLMVGLDVTHRCLFGAERAESWRRIGTPAARFLAQLADFSIKANAAAGAEFAAGMVLHDPLAVAVAADPELVGTLALPLRVELRTADGSGVRGRTTGDPVQIGRMVSGKRHAPAPTRVAITVQAARFVAHFTQQISALVS